MTVPPGLALFDERSMDTDASAYHRFSNDPKAFSHGGWTLMSSHDRQVDESTVTRCLSQARPGHPSNMGSSGHGMPCVSDMYW